MRRSACSDGWSDSMPGAGADPGTDSAARRAPERAQRISIVVPVLDEATRIGAATPLSLAS